MDNLKEKLFEKTILQFDRLDKSLGVIDLLHIETRIEYFSIFLAWYCFYDFICANGLLEEYEAYLKQYEANNAQQSSQT